VGANHTFNFKNEEWRKPKRYRRRYEIIQKLWVILLESNDTKNTKQLKYIANQSINIRKAG
jgi:hypothetical protein